MAINTDNEKNEMKDKAKDVYEKGKVKASEFYQENKDKAESTIDTIKDTASNLYEESKKYFHSAEDCLGESTDAMIKSIKEKPLTSILIAGVVGWALSSLFKK